jgi:hypothetical protein
VASAPVSEAQCLRSAKIFWSDLKLLFFADSGPIRFRSRFSWAKFLKRGNNLLNLA